MVNVPWLGGHQSSRQAIRKMVSDNVTTGRRRARAKVVNRQLMIDARPKDITVLDHSESISK